MASSSRSRHEQHLSFDLLMRIIELYCLVVAIDVMLAWVQEDSARWPRRLTHALTDPILQVIRLAMRRWQPGGWDISPVVLILLLTCIKLVLRG
jgi:uncharacterized protein YggT (Ycf19 family)